MQINSEHIFQVPLVSGTKVLALEQGTTLQRDSTNLNLAVEEAHRSIECVCPADYGR